jgi:hypothetical protein
MEFAILTFGMEDALLDHLRFRKVPLVFVDVGPNAPGIVNIRIDYLHGIRRRCSIWLRFAIPGSHSSPVLRG